MDFYKIFDAQLSQLEFQVTFNFEALEHALFPLNL